MLYFISEKEGCGFPKVRHKEWRIRQEFWRRQTPSNRGAQSQWVQLKSWDSQVAEENKEIKNPKDLPLGFLFEGHKKMREPRTYLKGAVYYTTVRAGAGEVLFREDADYVYFLELIRERKTKYNFKLYAFCLLPKHYHLLIETKDKNISKVMQAINTSYTLYFNNKYKRQGHLLAGRFQVKVINKDATLLELTYHIHLNPLRAGLSKEPQEYGFSSYLEYIKDRDDALLTDCASVLAYLGPLEDKDALRTRYRELTEEQAQKEPVAEIKEDDAGVVLAAEKIIHKKIFRPKTLVGLGSGLLVILVLIFVGLNTGIFRETGERKTVDRQTLVRRAIFKEPDVLRTGMLSLPDGLPQVEGNQGQQRQVWEFWKN